MEQNGNTKKEGLYFMRKKWEIEEEYRNFCRNNKELALQTLREPVSYTHLTLPTILLV